MNIIARAAILACLTILACATAQAGEAQPRLEPFQTLSRHGDWAAMTLPGKGPVPGFVLSGAGKPDKKVRLTLSFAGQQCVPLFGFQGKGRIGQDGAIVPLRLRVDSGNPRDFKARLRHTPADTTAIELEFRDVSDMVAYAGSLLDAKRLAFSLKLPGKPLGAQFNLEGLGQTVRETVEICRKAHSRPPPGQERNT